MPATESLTRKFLLAFGVLVVLLIGLFVVPPFANIVMPWDKQEAIDTALKWGGLAELPHDAEVVKVATEGSMFSRQFIVTFKGNREGIDAWVKRGKDREKWEVYEDNSEFIKYYIRGRGGAIGGGLTVFKNEPKVIIDMSWS